MDYFEKLQQLFIRSREKEAAVYGPTQEITREEYSEYLAIMGSWYVSSSRPSDLPIEKETGEHRQITN